MDAIGTTKAARSSFPNSDHAAAKLRNFFVRRKSNEPRRWKPPALHPATLTLAILIPFALILTLILLLRRSQRDNGIIFAPDINALPLSRTFMYQYFPTILAVVFSIFWAWIDLETKRLEPYYRLSEEKGALGKDSLLLAYPFGFVPLVPVKAFRQRHWPVFWVSLVLLLVTWGLVPTQAGIFSTENIKRKFPASFDISTGYMPVEQQTSSLTLGFAQSAYGIVSLNETLPSFMARNYTLAPFRLSSLDKQQIEDTETKELTAPTTLYSLDLYCEPAIPFNNEGIRGWNNSGCTVTGLLMGNNTIDSKPDVSITSSVKLFSAQYIGFWNAFSFADFYLSSSCPTAKNHTFFAAFTRNKKKENDPEQNVTAIFCEPTYFSQEVNATVDTTNKQPTQIVPLGPKQPLSDTKNPLNTTWLEMLLNGGYPPNRVRKDELPNTKIPSFAEQIAETNLTFVNDRQPLVGFSTLIDKRPLEDFLDWKVLAHSYAEAYRLLFARAMVDVLDDGFASTKQVVGTRMMATDAVVLEPVFTYIVVGFLCAIAIATIVLLYLSTARTLNLCSDPSTIGSVMGLVADSKALLQDFEDLDCFTLEQIQQVVQQKRYQLVGQDDEVSLIERRPAASIDGQVNSKTTSTFRTVSTKAIDKPVRPIEFSLWMSILFVSVFILLAALLVTVFVKARNNGLPLPSQNKFVQNLLENYIPTAIATLIEPLWVLINRLLCLLQPIEELQHCKAKAKDSIDLNYSSLPPQLVVLKALRARHFVLAAVCSMALLANILSIAFAGLFNHDVVAVLKQANFEQPYDLKFVPINGSVGPIARGSYGTDTAPSGAYLGGDGRDQFYILESNLSRGTPLPPWTDGKTFYLPFMESGNTTNKTQFESATITLGADLDCEVVDLRDIRFAEIDPTEPGPVLNKTVQMGRVQANCSSNKDVQVIAGPSVDYDVLQRVCQNGTSALELVLNLDALDTDATQEEKEVCQRTVILGWARNSQGTCKTFNLTALNAENSLFIQCQPRLVRGRALIRVDTEGRLVRIPQTISPEKDLVEADMKDMFESGPSGLIAQSNRYIFASNWAPWHNDSIATDFFNYFLERATNDTRFLDPKRQVPSLEDVQAPLQRAYSSLFAIWLGGNKDHLLVPRLETTNGSSKGWQVVDEERIFVSTPLFGIAQGILCTYALVACMVYFRRPGEYLARLPTNLASIIALFAGSTAVQGMRGISGLQKKERAEYFENLDYRYGYGSYVGIDGRVHIGIEKTPFVRPSNRINSARLR